MFQLDLPLSRDFSVSHGNYAVTRDGNGTPLLLYCGDKDMLKSFQIGDIGSGSGVGAKPAECLWSAQLPNQVQLVTLSKSAKNKIFCVAGSEVHAYTRKGKPFFAFDSNLTEQLLFIHVADESIFLATDHLVVHYLNGNEDWTYVNSNSDIVNMQIVKPAAAWLAVVQGNDGTVKIVDKGSILQQINSSALNNATISYISSYDQDFSALAIGCKGRDFSVFRETSGVFKQVSTISCEKVSAITNLSVVNDEQGNVMFICCGNAEMKSVCLKGDFATGFKQFADIELSSGIQESRSAGSVCVYKSISGGLYVHDYSIIKSKLTKADILEQIKQLTQDCAVLNREYETLRAKPAADSATLPQIIIRKKVDYEGDYIKVSINSNYQMTRLYVDLAPEMKLKSAGKPIQSMMQRDQEAMPPQTLFLLPAQKQEISFEIEANTGKPINIKLLCEFDTEKKTFINEEVYIPPLFSYVQVANPSSGITGHILEIKGKINSVLAKNWLSFIFPSINFAADEKDATVLTAILKCQRTDCSIKILFKDGMIELTGSCIVALASIREVISLEVQKINLKVTFSLKLSKHSLIEWFEYSKNRLEKLKSMGQDLLLNSIIDEIALSEEAKRELFDLDGNKVTGKADKIRHDQESLTFYLNAYKDIAKKLSPEVALEL